MPTVLPVTVDHHTIKYENAAIHNMLPKKVMGKNFLAEIRIELISNDMKSMHLIECAKSYVYMLCPLIFDYFKMSFNSLLSFLNKTKY